MSFFKWGLFLVFFLVLVPVFFWRFFRVFALGCVISFSFCAFRVLFWPWVLAAVLLFFRSGFLVCFCLCFLFFLFFFRPGCWAPCCFFFGRAFCVCFCLCFLFFLCFFSVPFWCWVWAPCCSFFGRAFWVWFCLCSLLLGLFLATLENIKNQPPKPIQKYVVFPLWKCARRNNCERCCLPFVEMRSLNPPRGRSPVKILCFRMLRQFAHLAIQKKGVMWLCDLCDPCDFCDFCDPCDPRDSCKHGVVDF